MKMKKITPRYIAHAGIIATIYVALTIIFQPISFGEMQVRVAEILTILPFFTPAAVPGLFIGCLLANIFGSSLILDIIIGSLSTLLAAYISYRLRFNKYLVPIPPIVGGIIFVPLILYFSGITTIPIPLLMLSVGIGQFISCGILGITLLFFLEKYRSHIFKPL
jgi:Predicted membrane protein